MIRTVPDRAGNATYVGTAALGCPVERSSTGLSGSCGHPRIQNCGAALRRTAGGGCPHVARWICLPPHHAIESRIHHGKHYNSNYSCSQPSPLWAVSGFSSGGCGLRCARNRGVALFRGTVRVTSTGWNYQASRPVRTSYRKPGSTWGPHHRRDQLRGSLLCPGICNRAGPFVADGHYAALRRR